MKKLLEIDKKLAELKALRHQVASREALAQRRERTQRCVILGAWLMANDPSRVEQIVGQLTRDQDRKLFGRSGNEGDTLSLENAALGK
jgi:hypothetical protein